MSQLYVRVFTSFYSHKKTLRLKARIGNDAFWVPPKLWSYAAENQPDGVFNDCTADEMAAMIGYSGDASSMLQALIGTGFLDENPLKIHDWEQHNGYHVVFSQRAKKAAAARWGKKATAESPSLDSSSGNGNGNGNGKGRQALHEACLKHPDEKRAAPRMFAKELKERIDYAEKEIERFKESDAYKQEGGAEYVKNLRANIAGWRDEYLGASPPKKQKPTAISNRDITTPSIGAPNHGSN